jgi:hypothetical protein
MVDQLLSLGGQALSIDEMVFRVAMLLDVRSAGPFDRDIGLPAGARPGLDGERAGPRPKGIPGVHGGEPGIGAGSIIVATLPRTIVIRAHRVVNTGGPESDTERGGICLQQQAICGHQYHSRELPSPLHGPTPAATRKVRTVAYPAPPESAPQLTPRDRDVLAHLIAAPDQQTAAQWLGITDRHLRRRVDSIMVKFGAETTLQMVVMATLNGDVDPKAVPVGTPAHRLLAVWFNRTKRTKQGTPPADP